MVCLALNTNIWSNKAFITLVYNYMVAIRITVTMLQRIPVFNKLNNLFHLVNCTCLCIFDHT